MALSFFRTGFVQSCFLISFASVTLVLHGCTGGGTDFAVNGTDGAGGNGTNGTGGSTDICTKCSQNQTTQAGAHSCMECAPIWEHGVPETAKACIDDGACAQCKGCEGHADDDKCNLCFEKVSGHSCHECAPFWACLDDNICGQCKQC